jgi:hypothetical protein
MTKWFSTFEKVDILVCFASTAYHIFLLSVAYQLWGSGGYDLFYAALGVLGLAGVVVFVFLRFLSFKLGWLEKT